MRGFLILGLLACPSKTSLNQSDDNAEDGESEILKALKTDEDDGSGEQEGEGEGDNDIKSTTKQKLLEKDIDPMGKMCVTLENDIENLGTNVKAFFTKAQ